MSFTARLTENAPSSTVRSLPGHGSPPHRRNGAPPRRTAGIVTIARPFWVCPMISTRTLPSEILDAAESGSGPLLDAIVAAGGAPLQSSGKPPPSSMWATPRPSDCSTGWTSSRRCPPLSGTSGTDLWSLTIDLPERSRIEYKIALRTDGRRRLILDPLNARRARDPYGSNSVVTGPLYVRPEWSLPQPGRGTRHAHARLEIDSPVIRRDPPRPALPPGHLRTDPLPLLVAHDGSEYAEYAALTVVLDNLIALGRSAAHGLRAERPRTTGPSSTPPTTATPTIWSRN